MTLHSIFSLSFVEAETENVYILTYRCDADPSALANYVVALVKKDKPEKELKALCADQLDVFLQKGMKAVQSFSASVSECNMLLLVKKVGQEVFLQLRFPLLHKQATSYFKL